MRRRLLVSTCAIAVAAVVVLGVPLGIVGTALLHNRAEMRLERRADAAAIRLARADARGQPPTLDLVRGLLEPDEALRVSSRRRTVLLGTPPDDHPLEVVSGDGGVVAVTLLASNAGRAQDALKVWGTLTLLGLAAVLAAATLAVLQARRLARPLEALALRVDSVEGPDFDPRPLPGRLPEVDRVQVALTAAAARIDELVRRERQITANASHQLRTPLTGLRLRLEELHRLAEGPEAVEEADAALEQADRLQNTIEHLEAFARRRDDHPEPVAVGSLIQAHVNSGDWPNRFAAAGRRLTVSATSQTHGRIRAESLRQVLDVLLDNALRHGEGPTEILLAAEPDRLQVLIRDAGDQLPASDGVFVRGVGRGTGLGLAVARELVERDGGQLRLRSSAPTTFELLLVTRAELEADVEAREGVAMRRGGASTPAA